MIVITEGSQIELRRNKMLVTSSSGEKGRIPDGQKNRVLRQTARLLGMGTDAREIKSILKTGTAVRI